jgi:hypothetical protein
MLNRCKLVWKHLTGLPNLPSWQQNKTLLDWLHSL